MKLAIEPSEAQKQRLAESAAHRPFEENDRPFRARLRRLWKDLQL